MRLLGFLLLGSLLALPATAKVIDAFCGSGPLSLDNTTIIRFATTGFPESPYPNTACSTTFNLTTEGFFVFEHINLAVDDVLTFSGIEDASLSGNQWSWNSTFFYPSTPQSGLVTVALNVSSEYQTAGFRLWLFPYNSGATPNCDDDAICGESQIVFSPGFPYDHIEAADFEVTLPVNSNGQRYALTHAKLTLSSLIVNAKTPLSKKFVTTPTVLSDATCYNGYNPANLTVTFNRESTSGDFFVLVVETNKNTLQFTHPGENTTLNEVMKPFQVFTNDRGSLYPSCSSSSNYLTVDGLTERDDYSLGMWLQYFDNEGKDNLKILCISANHTFDGTLEGNIYGPVNQQVADPNMKSYGDVFTLFNNNWFFSFLPDNCQFTMTSDVTINGAGGLYYAMAFPKKVEPATFIVSQGQRVSAETPGYPYGYATGASANYTFKGNKEQVLKLCVEDHGLTFTGFDTTRASLRVYEGDAAVHSRILRSIEAEDDLKLGCVYSENPGDSMFVRFEAPDTVVLQMLDNQPIPVVMGGRVTPTFNVSSLGFRFSVENALYVTPPTATESAPSAFAGFFSLILIAVFWCIN
ncbi:hypothetical protein QR680_005695 [Steinernema hermaphroditum]|uniref:CUB domain-containing protein n=1 Tax=Steinernema hermaphroditum TaxID=289476 RepID=A0AA39LVW7_9BILA|nr:hypothetical protein QR680_005695 [Steinernema hermaphroditum]